MFAEIALFVVTFVAIYALAKLAMVALEGSSIKRYSLRNLLLLVTAAALALGMAAALRH